MQDHTGPHLHLQHPINKDSQSFSRPKKQKSMKPSETIPIGSMVMVYLPRMNGWCLWFSCRYTYGCFLKWWYPQIIYFNRVFHYKPSILGYHHLRKHLYTIPMDGMGFDSDLAALPGRRWSPCYIPNSLLVAPGLTGNDGKRRPGKLRIPGPPGKVT